jgi:hypothetical protein
MLLTSRDGVLVTIRGSVGGTAPICTKLGLGLQLFVKNSTPLMNFMKIRRTFYSLTVTSPTDGQTSSSHTAFFLSFFLSLRKERLTALYLRLRVMCSGVPSYQYGCRVPVTPHAEVAPPLHATLCCHACSDLASGMFVCGFLLFCYNLHAVPSITVLGSHPLLFRR